MKRSRSATAKIGTLSARQLIRQKRGPNSAEQTHAVRSRSAASRMRGRNLT